MIGSIVYSVTNFLTKKMKKIIFLGIYVILSFTSLNLFSQTEISKEEREKALAHLQSTKAALMEAVDGLTEEQLNYKATPESWSIAECVEHIAISEGMIFELIKESLKPEADPSLRSEIKMTDDQVSVIIADRTNKVKTSEAFEPKDGFGSYEGSLEAFNDKRSTSIDFVEKTTDDLRNHYSDFPFGKLDTYQTILFMSAHTDRHTKQIVEVKENANFPM